MACTLPNSCCFARNIDGYRGLVALMKATMGLLRPILENGEAVVEGANVKRYIRGLGGFCLASCDEDHLAGQVEPMDVSAERRKPHCQRSRPASDVEHNVARGHQRLGNGDLPLEGGGVSVRLACAVRLLF